VKCECDVDQSKKGDNKYAPRGGERGGGGRTCRDWLAARRRKLGMRPHRLRRRAELLIRLRVDGAMLRLLVRAKGPNASR
jgi:hypothetical protein